MKIPSELKAILQRSIWLYAAVSVVFALSIDQAQAVKERRRYLLGIFYNQDFKNYQDGVVYFDYWARHRPEDERNYFLLGYCYLYLNDYDKAVRYFKQALNMTPERELYRRYLTHAESKSHKDGNDVPLPAETIPIPLEEL